MIHRAGGTLFLGGDQRSELSEIGAKPLAGGRGGQTIGLGVVFTPDVRDREIERSGQFPADPIQGIKARAAAAVFPPHLLDHDLRIGKHVKRLGLKPQRTLQRFQQSNVLGDIIVLVPDPFGDSDRAVGGTVHYHANTRWPGVSERAAVDVGHEI